jgi:hypothetical protein
MPLIKLPRLSCALPPLLVSDALYCYHFFKARPSRERSLLRTLAANPNNERRLELAAAAAWPARRFGAWHGPDDACAAPRVTAGRRRKARCILPRWFGDGPGRVVWGFHFDGMHGMGVTRACVRRGARAATGKACMRIMVC